MSPLMVLAALCMPLSAVSKPTTPGVIDQVVVTPGYAAPLASWLPLVYTIPLHTEIITQYVGRRGGVAHLSCRGTWFVTPAQRHAHPV
jgi:hypothetical protein